MWSSTADLVVTEALVPLIQLLSDGQYHSGQVIGERLGVSRAAVWKRIQQLDGVGLKVESVRGLGHRLASPINLLDEPYLRQKLAPQVTQLHVLPFVGSTNAFLLAQQEQGRSAMSVCIAEYQSAGRGRRGRAWVSPYGSNVYFSVSCAVDEGVAALEGLSLAIGAVIAQVLERAGVDSTALKWPNDILLEGKKLGGVLVEVGGDLSGPCHVVVGVGLNVVMPVEASNPIEQPWSDLSAFPRVAANRSELACALIQAIVSLLFEYPKSGLSAYRAEWETRAAYLNQKVRILSGANEVEGLFLGISTSGALRLQNEQGGVSEYVGGEVSLRVTS